ncbi:hypothetical protein Tco_1034122 [Tanacetum coccineum]
MVVSNFISKCCIKEAFTRAPTQYQEYLREFWYTAKTLEHTKVWVSTPTGGVRGEIGITAFRNAIRAHYLPHSSMYVPPSSITTIRPWFSTIGYNVEIGAKGTLKKSYLPPRWRLLMVDYAKIIWEDLIHKLNKKTREKIVLYPRFISFLLEHMAPKYDIEELTINPTQMCLWIPKLSNTLLQLKRFPKAKSIELEADSEENNFQNTHLSPPLRHPNPNMAIQKRKLSPVRLWTQAQAILHLPHLCFFHLHSESTSGHDDSADSIAEADPGLSAPNDSISS